MISDVGGVHACTSTSSPGRDATSDLQGAEGSYTQAGLMYERRIDTNQLQ